jgi:hypothetical protein
MNPKYRGDAKDLFKRGFLSLVRSFPLIRGPKVLPFFTDTVEAADVAAYLHLLQISDSALVSQSRFFPRQDRQRYINAACAADHLKDDLFLDPDKGLAATLRGTTEDRELITFDEAEALVPSQTDRILMIYDESVDMADRKEATAKKLVVLQEHPRNLFAFAYFNLSPNHPNVMFITNKEGRSRLAILREEIVNAGIPDGKLVQRN